MDKKPLDRIDYELYEFDKENGRIWSKQKKRWLKGWIDGNGYVVVWLRTTDGKNVNYFYHRVIAYVFCERREDLRDIPYEKLEVNHKNENQTDNRTENLEWCDRPYNINFGTGNKRRSRTNKTIKHTSDWNKKVSKALSIPIVQVKDNGDIVEWESIAECNANGFIQSAVSQCCNNKFHSEKKVNSHRRYKQSEWYFKKDYIMKYKKDV